MFDPDNVLKAATWVFENADDGGYPKSRAAEKFDLSDEESDALHEVVTLMDKWCRLCYRSKEGE